MNKSKQMLKLFFIVFFMQSILIFAQSPQPTTPINKCISGNCINGFGKMIYQSGSIYEGNWIDDKRNGKGVMHYNGGDLYDGDWKNDLKHGEGIYKYATSEVYVGHFENDKINGFGKFTHKNGTTYEGNWKDGLRDGFQKEYVSNNSSNNSSKTSSNSTSTSSSYSENSNRENKSDKKEAEIFEKIEVRRAAIKSMAVEGAKMKTYTDRIYYARNMVFLQTDLIYYLTVAGNSDDLTEEAKRRFTPMLQSEKETKRGFEEILEKILVQARKEK